MRSRKYPLVLIILGVLLCRTASAAEPGLAFNATSKVYELKSTALDDSEDVSLEAWLEVAPACPEGACIIDKWGPGSGLGYRLQVGPDGSLEFLTTAPTPCRSEGKLAADRPSHVVAVFSPRGTEAKIYIDGKVAASIPSAARRFEIPSTSTPLRVSPIFAGRN